MSAETSHVTDISGGASGAAASSKKATPLPKRPAGEAGSASASQAPEAGGGWPNIDVTKFFEESRTRLKEAFEQANGRFDNVRSAARDTSEAVLQSQSAVISSVREINERVLDFAQADLDRCYDYFKALTEAKNASDFMQAQSSFIRECMESQLEQSRTVAEASANLLKSAYEPLQSGLANVVENARKRM